MEKQFNKQAAIWTFVAVVMAFAFSSIIKSLNNQLMPLVGSLIYGILGLLASILTGYVVGNDQGRK
jgi:large-conductance mechanosensitive channel